MTGRAGTSPSTSGTTSPTLTSCWRTPRWRPRPTGSWRGGREVAQGEGELGRGARKIYRMAGNGASWTDGQGDTTITMSPRDLIRLADLLEGRRERREWTRVDNGDGHPRWEIGSPGD